MSMAHSSHQSNSEKSFEDDDDDDYSLKSIKMEPETMLTQDDDILSSLDHEPSALDMESTYPDVDSLNGEDSNEGIFSQHMDIQEPLTTLKNLLEQRLIADFSDFTFWLQDSQELEGHKNLVDQCVQGEGLVQVNVEIKTQQKRINIVDVLKPAEDYSEVPENNEEPVAPQETNTSKVIRWMVDVQYKQEQDRLKIPSKPELWTQTHVKHWLQWAVRQFNLKKLHLSDWNITGAELCALELPEFQAKVPEDPGDVFWTHLELLRKCQFVAVVQKDTDELNDNTTVNNIKNTVQRPLQPRPLPNNNQQLNLNGHTSQESSSSLANESSTSTPSSPLNKTTTSSTATTTTTTTTTTSSGQIQLWQFLLELLTSKEHRGIILWEGTEGQFRLQRPETVAQLWGKRKNKPSMNYEKLSRALRYYYEGDMISKVSGKRFAYKFDCDLKKILGYSAAELSRLVNGQKRNPDLEQDV